MRYTPYKLTELGKRRHKRKVRRARLLAERIKHPERFIAPVITAKPIGRDITSEVVKIIKPGLLKRLWVAFKMFIKYAFKPYNQI